MNLLEKLKAKKPFLYEDSKGLVAISGERVVRVLSDSCMMWHEKYKNIVIEDVKDGNYVKKVMRKISSFADFQTSDNYINVDKEKLIPTHGVNHIKIEEYLSKLTQQEKEGLEHQINKLEQLYKKYIA